MIGKWLAKRADVDRLDARIGAVEADTTPPSAIRLLEERIAAIERDLPSVLSLATELGGELRRIDERTATAALEIARTGRRVEALRRLVRQGGTRLDRVLASTADQAALRAADDEMLGQIRASLAILEHRIGNEAEVARRGTTAVFERIEALRGALTAAIGQAPG